MLPEPREVPDSRLIFNRRRFQLGFVASLLSCLVNFSLPSPAVPGIFLALPHTGAGTGRAWDGREFQGLGKGGRGGSLGMAPWLDPGGKLGWQPGNPGSWINLDPGGKLGWLEQLGWQPGNPGNPEPWINLDPGGIKLSQEFPSRFSCSSGRREGGGILDFSLDFPGEAALTPGSGKSRAGIFHGRGKGDPARILPLPKRLSCIPR